VLPVNRIAVFIDLSFVVHWSFFFLFNLVIILMQTFVKNQSGQVL
jgi:hypothetical protein